MNPGSNRQGPLSGIRIVEFAAIGPAPFAAMMLTDMGAEVIRIDRPSAIDLGLPQDPRTAILNRGRRSLAIDLKNPDGVATAKRLVNNADALIEGFRPGVMERMGLGPEICLAANPRLVYGRITGWGQDGPLAKSAGHDINFVALTGLLGAIGRANAPPTPPLNLVGDFGGGGMLLAFGIVTGLLAAKTSGVGDVVDAAMIDGVSLLGAYVHGLRASGEWNDVRGSNSIDSGAPSYDCYQTSDGRWIAIGAIESRFYQELIARLGLDAETLPAQNDRTHWPQLRDAIAAKILLRTRDEWCVIFEGADVCFTPVLDMAEAPGHPHNLARHAYLNLDNVVQPAPAPRFTRHQAGIAGPPPLPGEHTDLVLEAWGFSSEDIKRLHEVGAIF